MISHSAPRCHVGTLTKKTVDGQVYKRRKEVWTGNFFDEVCMCHVSRVPCQPACHVSPRHSSLAPLAPTAPHLPEETANSQRRMIA